MTIAGKVQLITDLLGGQEILDVFGEPTGELTPQIITKEEAIKLLNFPDIEPKDET